LSQLQGFEFDEETKKELIPCYKELMGIDTKKFNLL